MTTPSLEQLVSCADCEAVYRIVALRPHAEARCLRCAGTLYKGSTVSLTRWLALSCSALITFLIASTFPLLILKVKGAYTYSTIAKTGFSLFSQQQLFIGIFFLLTTQLFPLLEMGTRIYVLFCLRWRRYPEMLKPTLRLWQRLQTWSMLEVFLLGVFVTSVKLTHIAQVKPDIGVWALIAWAIQMAFLMRLRPSTLWLHPAMRPRWIK